MSTKHCVFDYVYRDAGNWKTYGALLLVGDCTGAALKIRDCLESGELFVAEQVGVPALCQRHWVDCEDGPSDLDHAYHEFVDLRPATNDDVVTFCVAGRLSVLLDRFQRAAGCWDVSLSPNCYV